jgi:hypothetical protein
MGDTDQLVGGDIPDQISRPKVEIVSEQTLGAFWER